MDVLRSGTRPFKVGTSSEHNEGNGGFKKHELLSAWCDEGLHAGSNAKSFSTMSLAAIDELGSNDDTAMGSIKGKDIFGQSGNRDAPGHLSVVGDPRN